VVPAFVLTKGSVDGLDWNTLRGYASYVSIDRLGLAEHIGEDITKLLGSVPVGFGGIGE